MAERIHPNFLHDLLEYHAAAGLWQLRWDELIHASGGASRWQSPWLNVSFADGSSQRDGNPIFSAVCPSRRLGVRVIQLEPVGDPLEFEFWTDVFAQGSPDEIRELVISCVLSAQTLDRAVDLMNQWVTEETVELLR